MSFKKIEVKEEYIFFKKYITDSKKSNDNYYYIRLSKNDNKPYWFIGVDKGNNTVSRYGAAYLNESLQKELEADYQDCI